MDEASQRAGVVAIARSWIGTPYHHQGRIKGVGVDCAMIVVEVFAEAGLIPKDVALPSYVPQWHLNRNAQRYLGVIASHARELPPDRAPEPGDVILFQFGRVFSHG